jgi:hypothetical protein
VDSLFTEYFARKEKKEKKSRLALPNRHLANDQKSAISWTMGVPYFHPPPYQPGSPTHISKQKNTDRKDTTLYFVLQRCLDCALPNRLPTSE